MSGNICRLCFEKKTRPIGIFTGKGIKLNIAEIIRTHFPDEVTHTAAAACNRENFLISRESSFRSTKTTSFSRNSFVCIVGRNWRISMNSTSQWTLPKIFSWETMWKLRRQISLKFIVIPSILGIVEWKLNPMTMRLKWSHHLRGTVQVQLMHCKIMRNPIKVRLSSTWMRKRPRQQTFQWIQRSNHQRRRRRSL